MNFDNSQHLQNKTKALPLREPEEGKKWWRTLDAQFIKVFDASVGTYYINKQINKIIVILGIVLIAYALIYHTYSSFYFDNSDSNTNQQLPIDNNGTKDNDNKLPDITGLISGGAGIASLITLFFYKSQRYIQQSLTNLAITEMIYKSHYLTFETISDYHSSIFLSSGETKNKKISIDEINKLNKMLLSYTTNYVNTLTGKSRFEGPTKIEEGPTKIEEGPTERKAD
ncbi:MAG TPA: hypothetical protein VLA74_02415 [Nitrososphaeraceae archaeon]|nr:hypothetical protein [Nitrososphaeraceae archaeon]